LRPPANIEEQRRPLLRATDEDVLLLPRADQTCLRLRQFSVTAPIVASSTAYSAVAITTKACVPPTQVVPTEGGAGPGDFGWTSFRPKWDFRGILTRIKPPGRASLPLGSRLLEDLNVYARMTSGRCRRRPRTSRWLSSPPRYRMSTLPPLVTLCVLGGDFSAVFDPTRVDLVNFFARRKRDRAPRAIVELRVNSAAMLAACSTSRVAYAFLNRKPSPEFFDAAKNSIPYSFSKMRCRDWSTFKRRGSILSSLSNSIL